MIKDGHDRIWVGSNKTQIQTLIFLLDRDPNPDS